MHGRIFLSLFDAFFRSILCISPFDNPLSLFSGIYALAVALANLIEEDRQLLQAAKDLAGFPLHLFVLQAQVGEAAQQGMKGDFAFESSEGRAQAEMDAKSEREM